MFSLFIFFSFRSLFLKTKSLVSLVLDLYFLKLNLFFFSFFA